MNEAYVVAVGKGALNKEGGHIPLQVNAGDKVILPPYGGSPVKVAEEVSTFTLCKRLYN
jgi:chaperonin GroES